MAQHAESARFRRLALAAAALALVVPAWSCMKCPDPNGVDALGFGPAGRDRLFDGIVDAVPAGDVIGRRDRFGPSATLEAEPYQYFLELAARETVQRLLKCRSKAVLIADCGTHPDANRNRIISKKYAMAKLLNIYYPPAGSQLEFDGKYVAEFLVAFEEKGGGYGACLLRSPIDDWKGKRILQFYKQKNGAPVTDASTFYLFRYVRFGGRFFKMFTRGSPKNALLPEDGRIYITVPLFVGPPPEPITVFGDAWRDAKTEIENSELGDFYMPGSVFPPDAPPPIIRSRIVLNAFPNPLDADRILYMRHGIQVGLKTTLANPPLFRKMERPGVVIRIHRPVEKEAVKSDVRLAMTQLSGVPHIETVYMKMADEHGDGPGD